MRLEVVAHSSLPFELVSQLILYFIVTIQKGFAAVGRDLVQPTLGSFLFVYLFAYFVLFKPAKARIHPNPWSLPPPSQT